MADPINASSQINGFTYIKYLKYGNLNQGLITPETDVVFSKTKKIAHSGQLIDNKIKIGHNSSAGPDAEQQFDLARSKVGTGESVSFQRKWFNTHSWGFFSEKVDFQTLRGGAAYREMDEKIKENKLAMFASILRDFWGSATGYIDTLKAVDLSGADAVITLNTNGMSYVYKGLPVQFTEHNKNDVFSNKSETTPTLTNSTFYIKKIDFRTNKITLDGKPTHVKQATTVLAKDDRMYFVGGAGASRQKGILSYVPSSIASNDSFLNVNRSLDPSILAGYYKAADIDISGTGDYAELVWDLLVDSTDQTQQVVNQKQNMLDCLVMNYKTHSDFMKSEFYKNQFRQILNQSQKGGQASLGVSEGSFKTSKGTVLPFKISNCVPDDEIIGLNSMDWSWSYLGKEGEFISFAREGDRYIFLDEKSNLYKFRLKNYSQVLTPRPSNMFRLKLTVTRT